MVVVGFDGQYFLVCGGDCFFECCFGDFVVGEKVLFVVDIVYVQGFGFCGFEVFVDDQFGGVVVDVYYQLCVGVVGEVVCYFQVDQLGFFVVCYYFDVVFQGVFGVGDELGGVVCYVQGVGVYYVYVVVGDVFDVLGEVVQVVQGSGLGVFVEVVVGFQVGVQLYFFG